MLGPRYAVAKQVFFVMLGPWGRAKRILSSVVLCCLSKLKFAATIYKMKDPLQGMSELVFFFPPINLRCEYSFMVSAWAPWWIGLVCCVFAR